MKDNTYANVALKASPISYNNNQIDEYRTLINKLGQLGPNNWPKFQDHLKKKKKKKPSGEIKQKKKIRQVTIPLPKKYLQKTLHLQL